MTREPFEWETGGSSPRPRPIPNQGRSAPAPRMAFDYKSIALGVAALLALWLAYQKYCPLAQPESDRGLSAGAKSAAAEYADKYLNGLADIYDDAADGVESDELVDIVAVNGFIKPLKQPSKDAAFANLGSVLGGLNGEGWEKRKAVNTLRDIAEGLRE